MVDDIVERPHVGWWISIIGGLGLTAALALSDGAFAWWSATVTTALSRELIRGIFYGAAFLHVFEASYAFSVAKKLGLASAPGWGLQTFILGFPSLRLLLKRRVAASG